MEKLLSSKDISFFESLSDSYKPSFDDRVLFFPIRHHSPICSIQLKKTVKAYKPDVILIEGPFQLNPQKDSFFKDGSEMPLAYYMIHKEDVTLEDGTKETQRAAVYYPFAEFSPEYVALEQGRKEGIETQFIDIPFSWFKKYAANYESVVNDNQIRYSDYITSLCEKLGVKDFQEFWEVYYEVGHAKSNPLDFISDVYSFCLYSRKGSHVDTLKGDGTISREIFMIQNINEHFKKGKKILVVTGGFHTPGLLSFPYGKKDLKFKTDVGGTEEVYVVPFSYDQIDERSGYQSGILFPYYNERVYQTVEKESNPFYENAIFTLHKFHDYLKERAESGTIVNKIEALRVMDELVYLRGKNGIGTKEIFDGVQAAYGKGDDNLEAVFKSLNSVMTGKKSGKYGYSDNESPVTTDFHRSLSKFRLENSPLLKSIELEPFKKDIQKEKSLFFHKTSFLHLTFAKLVFDSSGSSLDDNNRYLKEKWDYQVTTRTYTDLIEANVYGATIDECCQNKFQKEWDAQNRFDGATSLFINFLKLDIEPTGKDYAASLKNILEQETILESLVEGFSYLYQYIKLNPEISAVYDFEAIYERVFEKIVQKLYFTDSLAAEEEEAFLKNIKIFYQVASDDSSKKSDVEDVLKFLYQKLYENIQVFGGLSGMLLSINSITEEDILKSFQNVVSGAHIGVDMAMFLKGLFQTARELFLTEDSFIKEMNKTFINMDEREFLEIIPELRLAFTFFSPSEQSKIASFISKIINVRESEITKDIPTTDPTELIFGKTLNKTIRDLLQKNGLVQF